MVSRIKGIQLWVSGALVMLGLMMFDEILTEAMYCGRDCLYPIPLLGSFTFYVAEGIAWILILAGFTLLMIK